MGTIHENWINSAEKGGEGSASAYSEIVGKHQTYVMGTYFNQIIMTGSHLKSCEDLQIKRDDTFNP